MALGLLGLKIGMTQVFADNGKIVPVTVLQLGPCPVLQVRTPDRDGYHALQLGYHDKPRRSATRAERGHVTHLDSKRSKKRTAAGVAVLAKADTEPKRFIREFRLAQPADHDVGKVLTVELFKEIAAVDVTGTTKGRGFTGVMKRHNFAGLPASHGVKRHHRAPGGIGSHSCDRGWSGKIKKGKRMAGHLGAAQRTARNLKVVRVDNENHLLLVRGAVPGPNGAYVVVRPTNKMG